MAPLSNLVKYTHLRDQLIASRVRLSTFFETFDIGTGSVFGLKARLDALQKMFEDFTTVQLDIEYILLGRNDSEEELADCDGIRTTFENEFYRLNSVILTHIQTLEAANIVQAQLLAPAAGDNGALKLKLPTINLPTFDGQFENWLTFHDTYTSLIHDNRSLSPMQKFHYLRSALIENAAHAISSLETTNDNYDVAWKLICLRYQNKRLIVKKHIEVLFNLKSIAKESSKDLRFLSDSVMTQINILKKLGLPTDHWDAILVWLLSSKFDSVTRREWESEKDLPDFPTIKTILDFLQRKCEMLESIESRQVFIPPITSPKFKQPSSSSSSSKRTNALVSSKPSSSSVGSSLKCSLCQQGHHIYRCTKFLNKSNSERRIEAKRLALCYSCLRADHLREHCKSLFKCQTCNQSHHTLLHSDELNSVQPTYSPQQSKTPQPSTSQATIGQISNSFATQNRSQIYLSTAVVHIQGPNAELVPCRVLLDSGSQSNFITEEMCQLIHLKKKRIDDLPVHGISQSRTIVNQEVTATVKSRFNEFSASLSFLVLPRITGNLPSKKVDSEVFMIPPNIDLADPMFYKPSKIDMLLGAELFCKIFCTGQIQMSEDLPVLQKTRFGWILSGKLVDATESNSSPQSCVTHSYSCLTFGPLLDQVKKFWEIEDCQSHHIQSMEEKLCEEQFKKTIRRNESGRFVVNLPFKPNLLELGDSHKMALSRFLLLERRFKRQPELKTPYTSFIDDYSTLGHMEEVQLDEKSVDKKFYLPHHPVFKLTSSTTKLRVVFDASAKSTSGLSLNNVLMIGSVVQDDLFSIIARFRLHKFIFAADIKKMYRQILVQSNQTDLQRILWRSTPEEPIKEFRLTTVTYGTACAPYLATRCLKQISIETSLESPTAASVIGSDFYVDDLMTGSDSLTEALILQAELIRILKCYGLDMHKWYSNDSALLLNIPLENRESNASLKIDESETVKTLGLLFQPQNDNFRFSVKLKHLDDNITKRTILSEIASIFDPLGLVGPVITTAKILMQNLWELKVGWDDSIPHEFAMRWIQFRNQLHHLNEVSIRRWVVPCANKDSIDLHGFCDASQNAYGACIYLICTDVDGTRTSNLMCSKSRVAPIKTITIPKLELLGALLLAQLAQKVCSALKINFNSLNFWTDSTIVLAWLRGSPSDWKVFVANRVSQIQELTNKAVWRHVKTEDNPADYISRGLPVIQLIEQDNWWYGPAWMLEDSSKFDEQQFHDLSSIPETRTAAVVSMNEDSEFYDVLLIFSSLEHLQRVIGNCFRFAMNAKSTNQKIYGPLSPLELQKSLTAIIKLSQRKAFSTEIKDLQSGKQVNHKSKLLTLNPFLRDDIIRVGGRLENANLTEDQIHPIVLPQGCHLTKLLLRQIHLKNLHAGPQALLAFTRQKYWPLNGIHLAKETVRKCIRCVISKPVLMRQMMAALPPYRVQPSRPFINVGIDYGGPFFIKRTVRGGTKVKAYLALFVCTSTKAMHLELVSELTTNAFIAALRRFMGRRGKCSNIFSDNATNFTGANRELLELKKLVLSEEHQAKVKKMLAEDGISWHFIPPRSPHFGGLYEAGIKSVKYHLKRLLGQTLLTFEELNTVIIEIEAILNSRPISALSSDPSDLKCLTPGHFLIGCELNAAIEPDLKELQLNRLSRWQRMQQISQLFWRRWSLEYLSQLHQRNKWFSEHQNIEIGTLVIIKDDNLPSRFWLLGRITELHPGTDGKVRVVTLKTSTGYLKRAVVNLCKLPIEEDINT